MQQNKNRHLDVYFSLRVLKTLSFIEKIVCIQGEKGLIRGAPECDFRAL